MPRWVHRTTVDLLNSIAEADLPEPVVNYIEEPDLSLLLNPDGTFIVEIKYWKVVVNTVVEMTAPEKAAVDAAEDAANVTSVKSRAVTNVDITRESGQVVGLTERALIQNANRRINYLTNRVEELFAMMELLRTGAGNAATRLNRIPPEHPNQGTANPLTVPANFSLIESRLLPAAIQQYKDDIDNDTVT